MMADVERAELVEESTPGRATLVPDAARALELLEGALGPASPIDAAKRDAIAATCADVRRALGRAGTVNVALVGDRTNHALLEALIARPVFGAVEARGEGPLIVVRASQRAACRAILRGGRVEEFELAFDAREPEPERAREKGGGWLRALVRRAVAFFRALLGRREPALPEAGADPTRRVRDLVDPSARGGEVDEVWLTLPIPEMPETVTLYDVRGMMARAKDVAADFVRYRTDAAILVLGGSSRSDAPEPTRELARRLSSHGARVLVATKLAAADAARALGVDPARVSRLPASFGARELVERVAGEREALMGARTSAALRLAQRGIEEAIERDEARDREAIARLASYVQSDRRRRLDATRQSIAGAAAGRAIRILQSVLSLFEAEFVPIRDEQMRVASEARSLDELRASVAGVAGALRDVRGKLVAQAERFLGEATSLLAPPLLENLERRIELVLRDVGVDAPGRPTWPDLPKIELEDHLVADATLTSTALSADIGWTDSLRSFEKVKERCLLQLADDLERLSHAVQSEIMDSEPRVARSLHEGLEVWLEAAGDSFASWLERIIEAERAARDAKRTERLAPWLAYRDTLVEQGRAMSARFR